MSAVVPSLLAGTAAAVLVGLPTPRRLVPRAAATGPVLPAGRAWAGVLPVVVVVASWPVLGPAGAAVAGVLTVVVRRGLAERAAGAGRAAERLGAAEALAVLAGELRAGRTPEDSLDRASRVAVGPTRQALAGAAAAARVGGVPHEVLLRGADSSAVSGLLRGLAACWQVCQGTGSSLASAVDRLEDALREEAVRRDVVQSELAGPRATAALLAGLPVVGTLMAAGLGAHPLHVLLHTTVGVACLTVGLALDLLGLWWTGRIVAAAGGSR
jgi:tight adherence protein B